MKTVDLYNDKNECCGCWGCANICPKQAIQMISDNEGFLYPIIDVNVCIDCGLCKKVCPVKSATKRKNKINNQPHIALVSLNLTHNFGAVLSSAILENYLRKKYPSDYVINTINFNYPIYSKSDYKKISLCRDDDIYRKQRFYIFRDQFMNRVDTVKGLDEIDKQINYKGFISGYEFDSKHEELDDIRLNICNLDFETEAKKIILDANGISSVMCLADLSLYEEMIGTANVECAEDSYLYVYLEAPNYEIVQKANDYAKQSGLKIYYCSSYECDFDAETKYCYTDGPAEFLFRIKHADNVITDVDYCQTLFQMINENSNCVDYISKNNCTKKLVENITNNCISL